jgi:hypothetical protein
MVINNIYAVLLVMNQWKLLWFINIMHKLRCMTAVGECQHTTKILVNVAKIALMWSYTCDCKNVQLMFDKYGPHLKNHVNYKIFSIILRFKTLLQYHNIWKLVFFSVFFTVIR